MLIYEGGKYWPDKAIPSDSRLASAPPRYTTPPPQVPAQGSKQATGYVTNAEFAEIERMRGTGKKQLSRSQVVTKLIRLGLQLTLDNGQLAMLEPRIEATIDRKFDAHFQPLRKMLAKVLKITEEDNFILESAASEDTVNNAKHKVQNEFRK